MAARRPAPPGADDQHVVLDARMASATSKILQSVQIPIEHSRT